jgi:hypothetical protein
MAVVRTACRRRQHLLVVMLAKAVDAIHIHDVDFGRPPTLVPLLEARLAQLLGPVRELDPGIVLHERAVRLERRKLLLHSHRGHDVPHFLHARTHAPSIQDDVADECMVFT